jgi:hypothetical protein
MRMAGVQASMQLLWFSCLWCSAESRSATSSPASFSAFAWAEHPRHCTASASKILIRAVQRHTVINWMTHNDHLCSSEAAPLPSKAAVCSSLHSYLSTQSSPSPRPSVFLDRLPGADQLCLLNNRRCTAGDGSAGEVVAFKARDSSLHPSWAYQLDLQLHCFTLVAPWSHEEAVC